ncbi:MAG: hypothetical protein JNL05_11435 [Flavobacteriales bacterium]|nr:hypothetical protein [Flavobacteriales bacterium]
MRPWLFVALWAIACQAIGQVTVLVDTARAVQPWPPYETYSFPRIRLPQHPAVAARIDHDLCIDVLEVDPDTANGHLFDRVWGDTVGWTTPRLSYLEWSVRRPFPGVLEVELSAEGCGAYCEGFTTHYQYDLRTGRRLDYDSLFTPQGIATLNDTLYKAWTALLNGHIAGVVDSLADSEIDPEYVEFLRAELELYRNCLGERTDDPYVEDLMFEAEGVRFFISRCAGHVDLALDELDPVSFVLPYGWCGRWMRPDLRPLFPRP